MVNIGIVGIKDNFVSWWLKKVVGNHTFSGKLESKISVSGSHDPLQTPNQMDAADEWWMNKWMNEWMNEWTNERTNELRSEWIKASATEWRNEQMSK